ncbi:hypothetical protein LINPERPRIM_LOCUS23103, partial [Linum perenne]
YFSLLFSSSLCFCNQSKTSLSIQTPSLPAVSAFIITDTIFLGLFTTFSSLLLVIHKTPFLLSFPYSEDMHSFKSATASSSSSSSSSHRHHHHTIPSTMFHHPSQMYCSTSPVPPSFFFRGGTEEEEEECRSQTQFADLGEIHHPQQPSHLPPPPPPPFYHHDALDLTPSSINATLVPSTNTPHFVSTFNHPGVIGGGQIAECMETGEFMYRKGTSGLDSNSGMAADNSHHTDTSTDVDTTDDTNHQVPMCFWHFAFFFLGFLRMLSLSLHICSVFLLLKFGRREENLSGFSNGGSGSALELRNQLPSPH